jgi:hypothetical protein
MSSFIAFVFLMTTLSSTAFSQGISRSGDDPVLKCHSANVVDAGYILRVHFNSQTYKALAYADSFAGNGHTFFDGHVFVFRTTTAIHRSCDFILTDSALKSTRTFQVKFSSKGIGEIEILEGKSIMQTPESFTTLSCEVHDQLLRDLGCQYMSDTPLR